MNPTVTIGDTHPRILPRTGLLHVVCGCMFSGKTEYLISRVCSLPSVNVRVFKHQIDDRYDARRVVSHRRRSLDAIVIQHSDEISHWISTETRLIAVDEGHFFDDQLPKQCFEFAQQGFEVLVTALDNDSWGQPFAVVEALRRVALRVTLKESICSRCGKVATRTQRTTTIIDGKMVGGAESYEPRCSSCWRPPPASYDQMTLDASNTGPWVQQSS